MVDDLGPVPETAPDGAPATAALATPVFVSEDGRRATYLRVFGWLCAVLVCLWLAALLASAVGFRPLPGLPGVRPPSTLEDKSEALTNAAKAVKSAEAASVALAVGPTTVDQLVRPASNRGADGPTALSREGLSGRGGARRTGQTTLPSGAPAARNPVTGSTSPATAVRAPGAASPKTNPSTTKTNPSTTKTNPSTTKTNPSTTKTNPSTTNAAPPASGHESAPGQIRKSDPTTTTAPAAANGRARGGAGTAPTGPTA